MNITEVKIYKLTDSKVLALASITIDDEFVVSGLRVLQGQNGLFVSMPSNKNAKGEYHDIAFPITKEARQTIQDKVLAKFQPFSSQDAEDVYNATHNNEKGLDVKEEDLPF